MEVNKTWILSISSVKNVVLLYPYNLMKFIRNFNRRYDYYVFWRFHSSTLMYITRGQLNILQVTYLTPAGHSHSTKHNIINYYYYCIHICIICTQDLACVCLRKKKSMLIYYTIMIPTSYRKLATLRNAAIEIVQLYRCKCNNKLTHRSP